MRICRSPNVAAADPAVVAGAVRAVAEVAVVREVAAPHPAVVDFVVERLPAVFEVAHPVAEVPAAHPFEEAVRRMRAARGLGLLPEGRSADLGVVRAALREIPATEIGITGTTTTVHRTTGTMAIAAITVGRVGAAMVVHGPVGDTLTVGVWDLDGVCHWDSAGRSAGARLMSEASIRRAYPWDTTAITATPCRLM